MTLTVIPNIKGMDALKELQELDFNMKRDLYKNVPEAALVKTKFSDKTANSLTHAVLAFLKIKGHYCSRIQSQGQWNQKLGMFTKSNVKKGIGDVMAIIDGRTVMIEIKVGKDKLSKDQIKTQEAVSISGGKYWVIKDYQSFVNNYKELLNR